MIRVLWFSRHDLTPEQKQGLSNFFKDEVEVKGVSKTVETAEEIIDDAKRLNCNTLAVVLPVHLLSDLMKLAPEHKMNVVVPRNKREIDSATNRITFVYDGWELVENCIYSSIIFR